ncbi:kinase-like domain-containing protein [Pelagophyceae sp. CCMP2097]|nr:kinase-like domain-containing protein [Pelagophyceae sp. CCMP2097]
MKPVDQRKMILLEARARGMGLESSIGFGVGFADASITGQHSLAAPITEFGFRGESSRDSSSSRPLMANATNSKDGAPRRAAATAATASATPRPAATLRDGFRIAPGAPAPRGASLRDAAKAPAADSPPRPPHKNAAAPADDQARPTSTSKRKSSAPQRNAGKKPLTESSAERDRDESLRASEKEAQERSARLEADVDRERVKGGEAEKLVAALRAELDRARIAHDAELRRARRLHEALRDALEAALRDGALAEARAARRTLSRDAFDLGRAVFALGRETWEDGEAERRLKLRAAGLLERREALSRAKKDRDRRRKDEQPAIDAAPIEAIADDEAAKAHLAKLRRDEAELNAERAVVERRKMRHVRESQRARYEDTSKWRHRPRMNDRYVLLRLLGRGGFSEVWLAFDLEAAQLVAVKFHTVESNWSEAKREAYVRHTAREFSIQKEIRHPRIAQCLDVFEVSETGACETMAMVLEYCEGEDLDARLRATPRLVEADARAVLLQVLSGMRCLHTPRAVAGEADKHAIIHYDLKPGNILFDAHGDAKITDFGLSKIVSDNLNTAFELTSQGAGTYWYLPPECFVCSAGAPPKISGKVDVWSVGVIFFEMLYGRRPFGDGQTQQQLFSERSLLRATSVEFPARPAVSEGAKDLLRACFQHSQHDRPDMFQLCDHAYVTGKFP